MSAHAGEHGFTLIEVLMALTVFAMIAALSYGALGTAGNGFEILSNVRLIQEKSGWAGKQLRSDLRYLSNIPHSRQASPGLQAAVGKIVPVRIENDNRGDVELDHLWLLVREPGMSSISQVHYYIDEDTSHLMRESRSLLARDQIQPLRWDFGKAVSWSVEVWDRQGNQRQDWDFRGKAFEWPRAVSVKLKMDNSTNITSQHDWLMPLLVGSEL